MKKCSKCGVEKPESSFYKDCHGKNGLRSICDECDRSKATGYYYKSGQEAQRIRFANLKFAAIAYYSHGTMKCMWPDCGFSDIRVLCLDVIDGTHFRLKKEIPEFRSHRIYVWLQEHGYPDWFQVLCSNHNIIKRIVNHECKGRK